MRCLTILLIYVINIKSQVEHIKVQKNIFLVNDFWHDYQEELKIDNGYLISVGVDVGLKNGYNTDYYCFSKLCYPLKTTNLEYMIIPKCWMKEKDVNSFIKSFEIERFMWRLRFFFADKPREEVDERKPKHVIYMLPEVKSENCINFTCDRSIDIYMKHIKEMLEILKWNNLSEFNKFIKNVGKDKKKLREIEKNADFDFFYYENFSKCFKDLKKFIKDLRYLKFEEDNNNNLFRWLFTKKSINNKKTNFKVSFFEKHLYKKIKKNQKIINGKTIDKNLKSLLKRCCNNLMTIIFNSKIFLPIGENYDTNFYIEQFFNLINELVKEIQKEYGTKDFTTCNVLFSEITDKLKIKLENLQSRTVKDLFRSVYVPKHFSKLLKKEVETLGDYIEVEKIMCDYHNIFVYIINSVSKFDMFSLISYSYIPPISNDNYNLSIIDGINIDFEVPAKFSQIKGYNYKGEEVVMEKDTDFFFVFTDTLCCPSDVLKLKNIQEIEVISNDERYYKRFKVNEFLNA